jgi:hypothetical protein
MHLYFTAITLLAILPATTLATYGPAIKRAPGFGLGKNCDKSMEGIYTCSNNRQRVVSWALHLLYGWLIQVLCDSCIAREVNGSMLTGVCCGIVRCRPSKGMRMSVGAIMVITRKLGSTSAMRLADTSAL